MSTNIIDLKQVHLTLGSDAGKVHILKGLDLEVTDGQSVSIIGPSGSGKSSLISIISGLEEINQGSARITDVELKGLDEDSLAKFRRDSIGIIFQSFHLIANMTAMENVAVPLEFAGKSDAFKTATELLERTGLGDRLHHYPAQLSGGEQQRVAMARALANKPRLILADEPTGNLDQSTGEQISNLLFELQNEWQATLVMVTHDVSLAQRCDRVLTMQDGKLNDNMKSDRRKTA